MNRHKGLNLLVEGGLSVVAPFEVMLVWQIECGTCSLFSSLARKSALCCLARTRKYQVVYLYVVRVEEWRI